MVYLFIVKKAVTLYEQLRTYNYVANKFNYNTTDMNWIPLKSIEELNQIYKSTETAVLFKHSTRCPVSSMAKRSLEFDKDLIPVDLKFYYLDLIAYRDVSNKIVELWGVQHESPQVLVVKGDKQIYNASHSDIEMRDIIAAIS